MLEKTMKQILNKKINSWLETIDDNSVKKAIKDDLIITGGCFTSFVQNESPKDYDCYLRTKESVLKVANYYAKKWNVEHSTNNVQVINGDDYIEAESIDFQTPYNCPPGRIKMVIRSKGVVGDPNEVRAPEELGVNPTEIIEELDEQKADEIVEKEKKPFFPVFISSNAITLSNGIQIVVRFYGEPAQIHDTYDFVHTKAYYDYKADTIEIPKIVYEHIVNKTLRYTGSKYPVCSIFRIRKFIARGWTINAGQLLKICMQISALNLTDINVLEDQLIGVDSVYFMQLIENFRKVKDNDPNFNLTTDYLLSVVDKIF